ncbi:MAG TPA: branched-chain amino acid ABC transporter substrate-binding protein [Acidimicrobiales bacterium]
MGPPMRARWGVVVPAAVLALVAASCGSSSTTGSGNSGRAVKVGFFGALTGTNSPQLGINIDNGVKLAVQQYNAKGQGPKVALVPYDSQGNPAQAPQLAQKVITDHTVALVGPAFSGESKMADPILQQGHIVNVTPSATSPGLASHGWTYWHRGVGSDNAQGPAAATYIADKLNDKRVAVIDDNSEYGKGIADIVASSLPTSGATVPVRDHIDPKVTGYSATVKDINAGNVDAVFFGGYYQQAGLLVKQLRDAGNKAAFVSDDGTNDPGFVAAAGPAAAGSYVTCPCVPTPSTPAGQAFTTAYQSAANTAPGTYSAQGFDAANFILAAIRAGNTSGKAINSYLARHSYNGVLGTLRFNAQGEINAPPVEAYQVQNGSFDPVGVTS